MFGPTCGFNSILHVFGYSQDSAAIPHAATTQSIEEALNAWEAAPRDSLVTALNPPVYKSFELEQVLGGIRRNGVGIPTSAKAVMTSMFLTKDEAKVKVHDEDTIEEDVDPVTYRWEANVACELGLEEEHPIEKEDCGGSPSGLTYSGLLDRSFDDEFGDAIEGDISKVVISYFMIIIYLVLNLGKRDDVHSMMGLSAGTLVVIGFAYASSGGIGGICGVKTNPLNNNIPFLLLGLGVDDAFVMVSEFVRHSTLNPSMELADRVGLAARTGGMSVLVTSLTDALAFLVGASTKLPALSAFCIYAGLGVLMCFLFVFTVFVPLMVLNARRAESNYFDCCCCCRSKVEHPIAEPKGCLTCCIPFCGRIEPKEPLMVTFFRKFSKVVVVSPVGRAAVFVQYLVIFAVGLAGLAQLEKEFKLEWFFPDGSYVTDFMDLNEEYFSRGQDFTVYSNGLDMLVDRTTFANTQTYLEIQDFILPGTIRENWYHDFMTTGGGEALASDAAAFWSTLHAWCNGAGSMYKSKMLWAAYACNGATCTASEQQQGIADAKLLTATMTDFSNGRERYEVYRTMREDIANFAGGGGNNLFPYSQAFLYWEEVGIIDSELIKSLLITFAVVCIIVALLIPQPRIFVIVALNIMAAVVEVIGFSHYMGVKMNGISTIYYLICAGLAVDYSAHIAHVFKDSTGTSVERAVAAMIRIGPSVWNAVFSTLLAVLVLGFSKSYVFIVFFKVLLLVALIAGSHGLVLLPVLLSVAGGSNEVKVADNKVEHNKPSE